MRQNVRGFNESVVILGGEFGKESRAVKVLSFVFFFCFFCRADNRANLHSSESLEYQCDEVRR